MKRHSKVQQASKADVAVFLHLLVDGAESSPVESKSQIDKTILKDLIEQKVLYRHQVIRLVAEICKQGQKQISMLILTLSSSLNYRIRT